MKNIQIILILLFITLFCSKENEVLVELKNKDKLESIKRKDLQFIAQLNQLEKKEDLSVAIQNQILDELAFMTVGKFEQEESKSITDQKEINKSLVFFDKKAFLNAMNFVIQKQSSDFVYKYINIRLLFLRKDPKIDREEEAKEIVNQLNSAENEDKIQQIIFEKNENLRYRISGGFVEPFCYNCGQNPIQNLTDPLINQKENKFILITDMNGYWILRKESLKEIKESKIADLYEDYYRKTQFVIRKFFNNANLLKDFKENEINNLKQQFLIDENKIKEIATEQAKHQIRVLKKSAIHIHLQELQKNYNFNLNNDISKILNEKKVEEWDPNIPIFEFNQKKYTVSDFLNEIKKYSVVIKELTKEEILNLLHQVYINYEILKTSPYAKQAEEIKKTFEDLIQKQVYTNQFVKNQLNQIEVSEEEMKKYYELRKNNEFKSGERILTYNEVKEKIRQILLTEKRQKKIVEVKSDLFKKYEVKFYKERLKEGKI